ncbi:MAG: hypothetical protein U0003_04485 [Vampirovibrionales bacterium]
MDGFAVNEEKLRWLLKNASLQAKKSEESLNTHDLNDAFGASAWVVGDSKDRVINTHNYKVGRLDAGDQVYCAERLLLLDAGGRNHKGFIPLMAVVNNHVDHVTSAQYAMCGPCLNEIRSAVLGTHPTARMSLDSLVAFVSVKNGQSKVKVRSVGELMPHLTLNSSFKRSPWRLPIQVSPTAQQSPLIRAMPGWLFRGWIRIALWLAKQSALWANHLGKQQGKGPSLGSVVLAPTWYGFRPYIAHNAYTKKRDYKPPLIRAVDSLSKTIRRRLTAGVLVSTKPETNVLNFEDLESLAYSTKKKDSCLVITANDQGIQVRTYADYVPYAYYRS